jgi:hypothetical protein
MFQPCATRLAVCLLLSGGMTLADDAPPAWRTLPLVKDGKIDPAWTHLWGGGFTVLDDGAVRTACTDAGMGLLLYTKEQFGNCQIRVVYRSQHAKSNAGIYVRIDEGVLERRNDPLPLRERDANGRLTKESLQRLEASSDAEREAWYPVHHGYEVQIYDAGDPFHRTGAIYSLAPAQPAPPKDPGEWKTMVITLDGNRILVDVDGRRVTEFDPASPDVPPRKQWSEPKREHKRPLAGYIGLQNHDPGDVVDFKEVSVRPLPERPDAAKNQGAATGPFDGQKFQGRIAFSSDGNCNDEDDWGAFPVAAALLEAFGVTDRLVHVDYSNILPKNDPRFYAEMETSVRGSAERYRIPSAILFDCQKDLDGALDSIARTIDASSAEDPLYYVLAGPMEVPLRGILKSDPKKRKHVYCISHSGWNDGYSQPEKLYLHRNTKRDVIQTGINWVQVQSGSGLTNSTRTSSTPKQWAMYHWMRDSRDARLGWIYSRLEVEDRCDVSDATMTYFLLTGDENATPAKLKAAIDDRALPTPATRRQVRVEAENFRILEGFVVEHQNDRNASHRLCVRQSQAGVARVGTSVKQPYAKEAGVFDVEVRYVGGKTGRSEFKLYVGGVPQGRLWVSDAGAEDWQSHVIADVQLNAGDEIVVEVRSDAADACKLDYVQLTDQSVDRPLRSDVNSNGR